MSAVFSKSEAKPSTAKRNDSPNINNTTPQSPTKNRQSQHCLQHCHVAKPNRAAVLSQPGSRGLWVNEAQTQHMHVVAAVCRLSKSLTNFTFPQHGQWLYCRRGNETLSVLHPKPNEGKKKRQNAGQYKIRTS